MIKVQNVTKYYGDKLGVKDISFEIGKNEIVGLIGKNGAGKTTTLNIITGYISLDEGSVAVGGCDILNNPKDAKKFIGYLPEKPPIYMDMTVNEYLKFCADLKGVDYELAEKHLDEICNLTGIEDVKKRLCKNLSKGYKQRVGLAQTLVSNPEILILDEPTIGLDPKQIIGIRELIKALKKKHTILISSHILGEIAHICDKIIIIDNGEIAASDTLHNLRQSVNKQQILIVRIKGAEKSDADELCKIDGVLSADCIGDVEDGSLDFVIEHKKGSDVREGVFNYAVKNSKTILQLKQNETTLEDVFLKVTGKEKNK